MRVIESWTKEEQTELERAKESFTPMFWIIEACEHIENGRFHDKFPKLEAKYIGSSRFEEDLIIRDIADFYTKNAKFPSDKYYIDAGTDFPYFGIEKNGRQTWYSNLIESHDNQKFFTKEEIYNISPQLMKLAHRSNV